jgi:hypothetical protein
MLARVFLRREGRKIKRKSVHRIWEAELRNWELKVMGLIVLIALLAIMVVAIQTGGFSGNGSASEDALQTTGIVLMAIGGLAVLIGETILLFAAFGEDISIALAFIFLPFYSIYYALVGYESEEKGLVLTTWFGGAVLLGVGLALFLLN